MAGKGLMLESSKAPGCFLHKISNLNSGFLDSSLFYNLDSDITKQAEP